MYVKQWFEILAGDQEASECTRLRLWYWFEREIGS